jgi:hypothetical protein
VVSTDFYNSVVLTNSATGLFLTDVGTYTIGIGTLSADPGWSYPSNYTVTFVQGVYTVTGKTVTQNTKFGDWHDINGYLWTNAVDDHFNIIRTYGWYYSKTDLYNTFNSLIPLTPPPTSKDQFAITVNGNSIDDGTLLTTNNSTIKFTYTVSHYDPITFTNVLQVIPYTINVALNTNVVLTQVQRAYRDSVNLFPVLWSNKSIFGGGATNIGLDITSPTYTNLAIFDATPISGSSNASWIITNANRTGTTPDAPVPVIWLTNANGYPTNLYFAVTNELMTDLGIVVYAGAEDSSVGVYPLQIKATSSRAPNYKFNIVNGTTFKTKGVPALPNIEITNALLSLVVDNLSRAYGAANPPFTGGAYAYKSDGKTKYPNNDGIVMTFTNYTTTNSLVGTYPITYTSYSDPNYKASNYKLDTSTSVGTLTVTGALLTATAKSYALRPGQAKPTFQTKSIAGYVNGEDATVIITQPTWNSSYTVGAGVGATFKVTNQIPGLAANYTFAYVEGLVTISNNIPPTAGNDSITVYQNTMSKITIDKLLANDKSIFGDKLTLTKFDTLSTRGVPIATDSAKAWLFYNTAASTLNTNGYDTFSYTVKDTVGGTATAQVFVKVVIQNTNYVPNNIISVVKEDNGWFTMTFLGIDTRKYKVQGTDTLPNGTWTDLTVYDRNMFPNLSASGIYITNIFSCTNGAITVTDQDAPSNPNRFYRAIYIP